MFRQHNYLRKMSYDDNLMRLRGYNWNSKSRHTYFSMGRFNKKKTIQASKLWLIKYYSDPYLPTVILI